MKEFKRMSRIAKKWHEPTFESLFNHYKNEPDLMILDSSHLLGEQEVYSYLCIRPFAKFRVKNGDATWNGECIPDFCPWTFLQRKLKKYRQPSNPHLPPFQGGVIGYWGYELAHTLETFLSVEDNIHLPDCALNFYTHVVAYNNRTQEAMLIDSGFSEKPLVSFLSANQISSKKNASEIISNFTKEAYCQSVSSMRDCIRRGDIFQANFTQQFQTTLPLSVNKATWYLAIRERNPAPFSAYMQLAEDEWLISCSPERFIRLQKGKATTQPIKGTCPRDKLNEVRDKALQQGLINSKKDRSENIMIVDLMRNDLSRVCQPGSVKVNALCELQTFETVHHLVSTIEGQLDSSFDAIDLLKASFPPGSVTGAPKLKAMECISQLEKTTRGPYCGCLGYISFTGEMDTAVTIRNYMIKGEQVFFSAGGAVVLGSEPEREYEESLVKVTKLRQMVDEGNLT